MLQRAVVRCVPSPKGWGRIGVAVAAAISTLAVCSASAGAAESWAVVNSAEIGQVRADAVVFRVTYSYNPSGRPSITCRAALSQKLTGPGFDQTRNVGR